MIKKAVVMAAGKGTRMLPITENIPKHMIEINGKPFLYYLLIALNEAGFNDIAVFVSYKKEQIIDYLKQNPQLNASPIEQEEILGSAQTIKLAQDFVENDNFIAVGGDNLWSARDLAAFNIDDNLNYIAGYEVQNPEKYGVLVTKDNKLVRIHEKPKEYVGNLISTGLYKFTPEIFNAIKQIKLSPRGEYEIPDAISILANEGKVNVIKLRDFWLDLGCPEDIPRVSDFLREKSIV